MNQQLQNEEPPLEVRQIVEQLGNKKEEQKLQAQEALQKLGPEAIDELLLVLAEEAKKRKTRQKWVVGGVGSYVALMFILTIGFRNPHLMNTFGGIWGVVAAACAVSQKQKSATKVLAQFEDKRTVGPLLEALEFHDRDVVAAASKQLLNLLPRLQASDTSLLNEAQRKCLHRALNGKNFKLTLALLKALEQIGDSKAIPFVEKLGQGQGKAKKVREIQEAAKSCLPFLQQRAKEENARQTLLRASDANAASADILLRPATATVEVNPQELLRASNP